MIRSKLPDVGTTIFTVMSRLAIEHKAINLGQGFPDFDPTRRCARWYQGHGRRPQSIPYMPGVALRETIAAKARELYGHAYDPETEITVTSGAAEALMATVLAAVGSGDEVVVIEPCYDSYLPAIRLAGGTAVPVPLRAHGRRSLLPHRLAARARRHHAQDAPADAELPAQPHRRRARRRDLDALEAIVRDTGVLLLSDEVYEHIVFDGKPHASVARRPLLAEHAFVISSFGKTYHTTGWKIGYCCAPRQLSAELRKVHQFMVFTVPSPMQYALAEFMRDPKPYLACRPSTRPSATACRKVSKTRFRPCPAPARSSCWPTTAISPSRPKPTSRAT